MMGQIVHGGRGAFSGEINYANDPKKNAKLIAHSDGVFTLNNSTIIDSLESHCGLNPRVKNPMTHLILGFSAQDSAKLTDQRMAEIAKDYISRMGYEDTPFVIFRHYDRKHPHCHIITSRINNKGKTVKDGNEKWRNVKVCKQLGNPKTIAHESAREIYEQCKEDYQFRCTMEEFRHINEKFPDFDTLFAAQGKDAERPFPAIEGDYPDQPEDSTSEPNIVTVGLETLGILTMQPYEAHISSGGGGSSSDMKWNDEDKKRRQDHYHNRKKGLSR